MHRWGDNKFFFLNPNTATNISWYKLANVFLSVREDLKKKTKDYDKSENDLKALQSVGQIVGEVLKQLTEEKC